MNARNIAAATLLAAVLVICPAAARPAGTPSAKQSSITGPALADSAALARRDARPRFYLAWGAPYGTPGAREGTVWACDDTLAADSLYLSFDPGEDIGQCMGIDATLMFHSALGDTLGAFWDLSRKGVNPWNLRIEFEPPPDGSLSPWPVPGIGQPRYTLKGDTGRLDLTYYVPASQSGPIAAGTRYFFARVMIRMRKAWLAGCSQPVCVSFDHMLISYNSGSRWINEGPRFASWNSAKGGVCGPYRKRPPAPEPPKTGDRFDGPPVPVDPRAQATRDTTHR